MLARMSEIFMQYDVSVKYTLDLTSTQ